jgi:phosphopantetheinyl transferase
LPIEDQLQAFFDNWCAKEAYLKAVGIGTDSFEVSFCGRAAFGMGSGYAG